MESSSKRHRRDTRTEEQFEKDIVKRTLKEEFLAELFIKEITLWGFTNATYVPLGNKDAGKVTKRSNCDADYKFIIDEYLVFKADIKNCGVSWKMTYKVYDLEEYYAQGACILCFLNTGFIDDDPTKIKYDTTL